MVGKPPVIQPCLFHGPPSPILITPAASPRPQPDVSPSFLPRPSAGQLRATSMGTRSWRSRSSTTARSSPTGESGAALPSLRPARASLLGLGTGGWGRGWWCLLGWAKKPKPNILWNNTFCECSCWCPTIYLWSLPRLQHGFVKVLASISMPFACV